MQPIFPKPNLEQIVRVSGCNTATLALQGKRCDAAIAMISAKVAKNDGYRAVAVSRASQRAVIVTPSDDHSRVVAVVKLGSDEQGRGIRVNLSTGLVSIQTPIDDPGFACGVIDNFIKNALIAGNTIRRSDKDTASQVNRFILRRS